MHDSQYALNDDQKQIQDLIRRVARERVAPRANDIDSTAGIRTTCSALLKELGLIHPAVSRAVRRRRQHAVGLPGHRGVRPRLLQHRVPAAGAVGAFGAILHGGTEEQKARLLPGLASGDLRGAFSTTEAQSGSDVSGIKTRAEKTDGGFIQRRQDLVHHPDIADFILVAAKYREHDGMASACSSSSAARRACRWAARKKNGRARRAVLLRCSSTTSSCPRANMLGGGFKAVMEAFNASRPLIGARGVGLAQGARWTMPSSS